MPAKPKPGTGKRHANHRRLDKNEFDPKPIKKQEKLYSKKKETLGVPKKD